MQAESDIFKDFSDRLNNLQEKLGGMTRVAVAMGVSRETLYAILKRKQTITDKTLRKLAIAEGQILTGKTSKVIEESQAPFGGKNMRHEIEEHMRTVLAAAGADPIRLSWVLEQLRNHVSIPARWHADPLGAKAALAELTKQAEENLKARSTYRPPAAGAGGQA